MELGYLWLAISLFLCLLTTGAAVVRRVVAFPLMREVGKSGFSSSFSQYRKRNRWSYNLLAFLAVMSTVALLADPPYRMPDWALQVVPAIFGALLLILLMEALISRRLPLVSYDEKSARRLSVLGVVNALLWPIASTVLVWVFIQAVGLI